VVPPVVPGTRAAGTGQQLPCSLGKASEMEKVCLDWRSTSQLPNTSCQVLNTAPLCFTLQAAKIFTPPAMSLLNCWNIRFCM